jgi:RES domain-containing protein
MIKKFKRVHDSEDGRLRSSSRPVLIPMTKIQKTMLNYIVEGGHGDVEVFLKTNIQEGFLQDRHLG